MLRALWTRHPIVTVTFGLACAAVLFFAVRLVLFTLHWSDPANRNQPIAGWMTPGYVALSWHVPKPVIMQAAGLADRPQDRMSLDEIARMRGMTLDALIAELEAAILAHKQSDR